MTPDEVIAKLDEALKLFGTYPLYDKGAHEVMDVPAIVHALHKDGAIEAGKALLEVRLHEHGDQLVEAIVGDWDQFDDFDLLVGAYPDLAEFY